MNENRPSHETLVAGSRLSARYELRRELAGDHHAVDWQGFDTVLDRPVLVRLLRPELAQDDAAVEQFRREMRAAARAVPPQGARVLDAGYAEGTGLPFVVFEW